MTTEDSFGTIVDTNVLLDVFADDPTWADWSAGHLAQAFDRGPVVINPLIYAELAMGFDRIEDLDAALPTRIDIAAHAALSGRALLTRDRPRYASHLPALVLITPS